MIGGKFGLERKSPGRPSKPLLGELPSGSRHFFLNARSALAALVARFDPPRVWFPSYFCPSMVQGLGRFKDRFHFYPVSGKLEFSPVSSQNPFSNSDLVVAIEYFGFPPSSGLIAQCNQAGASVVVDACQALLSRHDSEEDRYFLFSIRKFFGVPDGSLIVAPPERRLDFKGLEPVPSEWLLDTIKGLELRRDFDLGRTDSREWFELLQESERRIPCGNFAMSDFSREMIEGKLDISEAVTRRRKNFEFLLQRLGPWALYDHLPESVAPFGFPVKIRDRDAVQHKLFESEIYPPIHWRLDGVAVEGFEESFRLSNEIMTLPCDQRYGETEMSFLAQTFRSVVANL